MRSDLYLTDSSPVDAAPETSLGDSRKTAEDLTARQSRVQPGRRSGSSSGIFARIIADAGAGAREYVDRWVAGRGAE